MTRSPVLLACLLVAAPLAACGSGSSDAGPSSPGGALGTPSPAPGGASSSAPAGSSVPAGSDAGAAADGAAPAPGPAGAALWTTRLGGPQADNGAAVAVDPGGGVIVAGTYQGTATVGGVPLDGAGQIDFFVAKYAASGAVQWVRPFGGPGNDAATSVAVDKMGNVYVAGASDGALTLGGSSFGQTSATGAFLLAIDPFGNVANAKAYGGDAYGTVVGVAVAADGTVGLCGSYKGQIDLGGGPITAAQGTYAGFAATFDASLKLAFAQPLGTSATAVAQSLAFNASGQLAVVGTFSGTGTFGGAALTSAGGNDVFVTTFDATGAGLASKSIGGLGQDDGRSVTFDATGDLLIAGGFADSVDFGGGAVTSQGALDAFVVKLTAGGTFAWAKTLGGAGVDEAVAVAVDASGGVLLGGEFEQTMTVGATPLTSAGDKDVFAVKLTSSGSLAWGKRFGSLQADEGAGVAFDAKGNGLLTGYFRTNVDFGTGMQTSAGDDDVFVAAFAP